MAPKAFKPPRPVSKASTAPKPKPGTTSTSRITKTKPTTTTTTAQKKASAAVATSISESPPNSPIPLDSSPPPPPAPQQQPTEQPREQIPKDLLTTLTHEVMSEGMRISRSADAALQLYVDVFVREAIARARWERVENGDGGDFLEVEDLEKLCPQLVLDF